MGLFSLFGKKNRSPDSPDDGAGSSANAPGDPPVERRVSSRPPPNQIERRVAARATAQKIDAIETEMTLDILGSVAPTTVVSAAPAQVSSGNTASPEPISTQMPPEGDDENLLDDGLPLSTIEVSTGGSSQDMEEAAILFASKQYALAESMLRQALLGEANWREPNRSAWWMLFDLYQVQHRRDDFENLSIDYAGLFETSPPAWSDDLYPEQALPQTTAQRSSVPVIAFAGQLDQSIAPQLQRLQALPAGQPCRLDFARVAEVEPAGCALLLSTLQQLRKAGHELVLTGAEELANKIRGIVKNGRLDETATTWLLLLEILRLLNREEEFEEASIDYCVTFEVSPPQFEAPIRSQASMAAPEAAAPPAHPNRFMMPGVIEGDCSSLAQEMLAYAERHQPVLLDCSHLARIEFVAAGQLLNQLAPLAGAGKSIEFHSVNHLVHALFNLMGLSGIAKIIPRRY